MTIIEVIEKLKESDSPGQLSELLMEISAEFAYLISQLDEIQKTKAKEWLELRELTTSDSQADKKWDRTEKGIAENSLKNQVKAYDKLMSSIKRRLRIMELEAQNIL